MKTTYTPGPWSASTQGPNDPWVIIAGCGPAFVASVEDDGALITRVEANANARLIAAAPDLLAALEDAEFLLRMIGMNPKEAGAMVDSCKRSSADARAAIAKARGESCE